MTWALAALALYLWLTGGLMMAAVHFEDTNSKEGAIALWLLWPVFLPVALAMIVWRAARLARARSRWGAR
jgi:hypothetical protein